MAATNQTASGTSAPRAHALLAVGGFAIGTAEFATMSFLPAFTRDLGVDVASGGHVVSAYALGVVVGAPLLAVAGAHVERRRLLLALLAWFGLGNLASALAPGYASLAALRFLTALPHGGYFGSAVLLAAGMVDESRRGAAVGRILMGLALATVTGVPLANLIAQWLGWRAGFGAIGLLALATAALLGAVLPAQAPAPGASAPGASARRELAGLARAQVWLTLAIGATGFGGLFAVYTYLVSTLAALTRVGPAVVPVILALFGAGMATGNAIAPRLARRGSMRAAAMLLAWSAAALAIYPLTVMHAWSIGLAVFAIGVGGGLGTVLQMRLMEVAGEAQTLAASLNHAAFNVANAIGPWLGGLAIAGGGGWRSTGWVGCALALGGLMVWLLAARLSLRAAGPARSA